MKALFYVHVFVSGKLQLCSLLYPVRQLYHASSAESKSSEYPISRRSSRSDYRNIYSNLLTILLNSTANFTQIAFLHTILLTILRQTLLIPLKQPSNPILNLHPMGPSQTVQLAHIYQLAHSPVRLGSIELDCAGEPYGLDYQF